MIKKGLTILGKSIRPADKCLSFGTTSRSEFRRIPNRIIDSTGCTENATKYKEIKYKESDLYSDSASYSYLLKNGKVNLNAESFARKEAGKDDNNYRINRKHKFSTKSVNVTSSTRRKAREAERKVSVTESGIEWSLLPEPDPNFLRSMADLKNKRKRDEMNKILLEGRRLINEALTAGLQLHSLYFTDEQDLDKMPLLNNNECKCYKITSTKMEAWSDLDTPPGIIVEKPSVEFAQSRQSHDSIPLTVILDNLRDPGNVGSLLRSLSAVGCQKVLTLKGCCDVWDQKVLRGGMGAHFVVPIEANVQWEYVRNYLPSDFDVLLADSNSYEVVCEAESYKLDPNSVLELNNLENNEAVPQTSHLTFYEEKKDGSKVILDKELKRPKSKYRMTRLPVIEHYCVDFSSSNHLVLIIGSETAEHTIDHSLNSSNHGTMDLYRDMKSAEIFEEFWA